MNDESPTFRTAPALAGVTPQARRIVADAALFRQGDPSAGIYYLADGEIRMQRTSVDGSAVVIHTAQAGQWFAEASLFSAHYHCDAIAARDSCAWLYPAAALRAGLREDPQALWSFAADLARELQGLRLRYELKQTRSATRRLQQLLSLRADADGEIALAGSLKDLAAELGLTHEALYRAVATLERGGRITRSGRSIRLDAGVRRER